MSKSSNAFVYRQRRKYFHGGAWKVAYADFVTGMMSLFLVLWILSQDEEVIIATTRFFRDPYKAGVPKSTPVDQKDARPGSMVDQIVGRSDTTMRNTDDTTSIDIDVLQVTAPEGCECSRLTPTHMPTYTPSTPYTRIATVLITMEARLVKQ